MITEEVCVDETSKEIEEIQYEDVERKYDIIQRREKAIKTIKNLSTIAFLVSLVIMSIYPLFTLGENQYSMISIAFNKGEPSVGWNIEQFIAPFYAKVNQAKLWETLSAWYVILKVITIAFAFIIGFFKTIFGGLFRLFRRKEVSHEAKAKAVEKYIKKNKNVLLRSVIGTVITYIIKLLLPGIADFIDMKDDATSIIFPIIYAIMCIECLFFTLNLVPAGAIILDMPFTVDMTAVTVAMVCGVLHTILLLLINLLVFIFRRRKLD